LLEHLTKSNPTSITTPASCKTMLRITPNVRRRPAKRREVPRRFPAPLFIGLARACGT